MMGIMKSILGRDLTVRLLVCYNIQKWTGCAERPYRAGDGDSLKADQMVRENPGQIRATLVYCPRQPGTGAGSQW